MNFGPHPTEDDAFAIMDRALEQGVTFFDTANVYGGREHRGWTEEIWQANETARARPSPGGLLRRGSCTGPVRSVRADRPGRPTPGEPVSADEQAERVPFGSTPHRERFEPSICS
ncbi:hypothetical protein CIK81_02990 [Brachybacterium sp. JB7]|nr:hypothetical protein CIK81_02990 [Brachybacterium sp. JB7]